MAPPTNFSAIPKSSAEVTRKTGRKGSRIVKVHTSMGNPLASASLARSQALVAVMRGPRSSKV